MRYQDILNYYTPTEEEYCLAKDFYDLNISYTQILRKGWESVFENSNQAIIALAWMKNQYACYTLNSVVMREELTSLAEAYNTLIYVRYQVSRFPSKIYCCDCLYYDPDEKEQPCYGTPTLYRVGYANVYLCIGHITAVRAKHRPIQYIPKHAFILRNSPITHEEPNNNTN